MKNFYFLPTGLGILLLVSFSSNFAFGQEVLQVKTIRGSSVIAKAYPHIKYPISQGKFQKIAPQDRDISHNREDLEAKPILKSTKFNPPQEQAMQTKVASKDNANENETLVTVEKAQLAEFKNSHSRQFQDSARDTSIKN